MTTTTLDLLQTCERGEFSSTTTERLERLLAEFRSNGVLPSENEELDDVATEDLKALLIEHWLAISYTKTETSGMPNGNGNGPTTTVPDPKALAEKRAKRLELAVAAGENFLLRTARLTASDKSFLPNINLRPTIASSTPSSTTREEKIARFKTQKALKDRLATLPNPYQVKKLTGVAKNQENGSEVEVHREANHREQDDAEEEEVRESWVVRLQVACYVTLEEIDNARRELQVLNFMRATDERELGRIRDERERAIADDKTKETVVTRVDPGMRVTKETLREGVFKPYHNLPTMSLEEYAKIETERALEREKREMKAEGTRVKSLNELHEAGREDENEEEYDAATLKARNWDDWKDGVPKGAGVTKRI